VCLGPGATGIGDRCRSIRLVHMPIGVGLGRRGRVGVPTRSRGRPEKKSRGEGEGEREREDEGTKPPYSECAIEPLAPVVRSKIVTTPPIEPHASLVPSVLWNNKTMGLSGVVFDVVGERCGCGCGG